MEGSANADLQSGPPTKRRRVALACNSCRVRKTRCNGAQPRCSLCSSLDFECQYEATESATNIIVRKEYLLGIEQRLQVLERTTKIHSDQLALRLDGSSGEAELRPEAHQPRTPGDIHIDEFRLEEFPSEDTTTDGMAITFVDEQDSGFFGPSSNIAFLRQIIQAMASKWNIVPPTTPSIRQEELDLKTGFVRASRAARSAITIDPSGGTTSALLLPPHAEIERLLLAYFANTGLIFPYVHERSFMESYQQCRQSKFKHVRRTWLGLLNIILAMAVSTQHEHGISAAKRIAESELYYERAKSLCGDQMLRGSSLEMVQYLLLTSQYLQGAQRPVQTWMIHGLAVKAGLSIGLHSNYAANRFSPEENETRKRVWYGCVLLDRSLCLSFGRPSAISDEQIRLPLPVTWPKSDELPENVKVYDSISTAFYVSSIGLYKIVDRTIKRLYGANLGCDPVPTEPEMIPHMFLLEQEISQWVADLSPDLGLIYATEVASLSHAVDRAILRFRVILTLRYSNIELLVHRPFLIRALGSSAPDHNEKQPSRSMAQIGNSASQACIKAAHETISIVHTILVNESCGKDLLGAWWFTLFYVFNAALIVHSMALVQESSERSSLGISLQSPHDAQQYLSKAIDALSLLDTGNAMVLGCKEYLQNLLRIQHLRLATDEPFLTVRNGRSEHMASRDEYSFQDLTDTTTDGLQPDLDGLDFADILSGDLELGRFFLSE
ncbi:hypothetical protein AUEXF2481DRAFT_43482 [Aureobasidium subglaciale EXF-2481]|uniref:Zn(2)-C6 fungal-type domain-containing protein n=1 Tax=Aureobasidium subglaciale (strain EXF-2481) TaxID=1043005 RepID=A0A074Y7Y9_AURSE|nr:uncharacterized protein AUEXF2481DRAFT_43482 [Aureobasidium subglaciale EXF-2481]KEQ92074.1 hypothetical protein AUEXF2481DRAFT_43482 [Aureobasidium subglaciale EXF-2481]